MKVQVKVEGQSFEVEVGALDQQPVVVMVDGERFEVWVDAESAATQTPAPGERPVVPVPPAATASDTGARAGGAARPEHAPAAVPAVGGNGSASSRVVVAPIPGLIRDVLAKPGDPVQVGQELFVLEAMKMKSSIRSPRAGRVAAVHVSPGQHVRHQAVLLEFAD